MVCKSKCFQFAFIQQKLSAVPIVVQIQQSLMPREQREAHQWTWPMTQSQEEICNMQRKKKYFWIFQNLRNKKLCYKTTILTRLVVEKNGTQETSILWFKTTSNYWYVNHFTTFSCLGPHTHLWGPKISPLYLPEVRPRRGVEGPTSPRLSQHSLLNFICSYALMNPGSGQERAPEKSELGSRCKTWLREGLMKARRSRSLDVTQMEESEESCLGKKRLDQRYTQDECQWDGMAFVKIRGKEVPTQGFGGADGLEQACCRGSECKARSQN